MCELENAYLLSKGRVPLRQNQRDLIFLLTPFIFIFEKKQKKIKMKTYDFMITLFRRQYVDQENPNLGLTDVDYFLDEQKGFFPLVGKPYFCLDYCSITNEVKELDTQPRDWRITQRNLVEYMAIGIDQPARSLKEIALEHAHIFIQFKHEIESGNVLRWLQREFGHKKFKLIACAGTSEEANDYCRAVGKYGGVDNPDRKNADGLPSTGGCVGEMTNHEPKRNRQGKKDESVAEIHQYITDHALDSSLDMSVFFFCVQKSY